MERPTDVPESLVQPAAPVQANGYDSFAEAYSAETENNLLNVYCARPRDRGPRRRRGPAAGSWTPAGLVQAADATAGAGR